MKKTLKKILDELNKEVPRLDYIRGILEVLIENEDEPIKYVTTPASTTNFPIADNKGNVKVTSNEKILDEAEMLDATAREKLAEVKKLADESVQEN